MGEHIRHVRLQRGLTQQDAAKLLGVVPSALLNWEKGRKEPSVERLPAIFRFLGYHPWPVPKTFPERLLDRRRAMGWSISWAARQTGVDPATWSDWERGKVILIRRHRNLVAKLLGLTIGQIDEEMRYRWNRSHNTKPTSAC